MIAVLSVGIYLGSLSAGIGIMALLFWIDDLAFSKRSDS